MNKPFFTPRGDERPRTAIFMSGSGSNAEVILKLAACGGAPEYEIAAIVTDNPEKSRAAELAGLYGVPLVALSIREFYHANGEPRISLATPHCWELREQWTRMLLEKLRPLELDFAIFAGFVPLCGVTGAYPCLNVHPGDLTVTDDSGRRLLVGLHTIPVELAILAGLPAIRSSVMVAQPLLPGASNMDDGPILGISAPMPLDLRGASLEELRGVAASRPGKRPVGGYRDLLEEIAAFNQDQLKYAGDHVVLPRVASCFASGMYASDDAGNLLFHAGGDWREVCTVEFSADGGVLPLFA
ncbi:MAG: hypothetical protein AB7F40_08625 [Victivallaceae bacterium]|nr:hypothetical protein [Victivallaceae bacterium]